MLNRQAVCVPSESALDVKALLRPVSWDDVLNGRGEQVAIVRQARRKGRSIVEGIEGLADGQLDLTVCEHGVLRKRRDVSVLRTCVSNALMALHLSMVPSSSLGKSIDMLANASWGCADSHRDSDRGIVEQRMP